MKTKVESCSVANNNINSIQKHETNGSNEKQRKIYLEL